MMSRMTAKGQVTIPKSLRERLGLVPGGEVEFDVTRDGFVIIRVPGKALNQSPIAKIKGAAVGKGPDLSTDEIMRLTRGDPD